MTLAAASRRSLYSRPASSEAAPNPTIRGTGSVPGRQPISCPPPYIRGVNGRRWLRSRRRKSADALRSIDFMAANRQEVASELSKCLDLFAEGLRRIDMKERLRVGQQLGDLNDRLQHTCLVVRMHHRHQQRLRSKSLLHREWFNVPSRRDWQQFRFKPALAQLIEGFQDRLVLDGCGEDVSAISGEPVMHETEEDQVVALCASAREEDFIAPDVQEIGYLLPRRSTASFARWP